MQQVAVRKMKFDAVEFQARSARRRRGEFVPHAGETFAVECLRQVLAGRMRDGRRRERRPSVRLAGPDLRAALPRASASCFRITAIRCSERYAKSVCNCVLGWPGDAMPNAPDRKKPVCPVSVLVPTKPCRTESTAGPSCESPA